MSDAKKAQEIIRQCYEDGMAEINGREYKFTKATHNQRRRVFAYYSKISGSLNVGDFSFLDTAEWKVVEDTINKLMTFEGKLLETIVPSHWEAHPGDYLKFVGVSMPVICYPFLSESLTD